MKKVVIAVLVVLIILVAGLYVARSIDEHRRIKQALAELLPQMPPFCQQEQNLDPRLEPYRTKVCDFQREENAQLEQAARASRTNKEFLQKSQQILEKNTGKMNEILKSIQEPLGSKEEVAQ